MYEEYGIKTQRITLDQEVKKLIDDNEKLRVTAESLRKDLIEAERKIQALKDVILMFDDK